jgi:hypothetical protein
MGELRPLSSRPTEGTPREEVRASSIGGRKTRFRRSRGKNLPYKAVRRIRPPRIRGRFCRRPLEGPLETGTTCPPRVVGASDSPNCLIRQVFTTGSQKGRILLKRRFLPPIEEGRGSFLAGPSCLAPAKGHFSVGFAESCKLQVSSKFLGRNLEFAHKTEVAGVHPPGLFR